MNLQQLRYLVATAEEGTMTAAARACAVAQPALTRGVRGLERELGVALFRRRGRTVELTDEGRVVADAARRVLAEVLAIEEYARGRVADRVLTIAATPTLQSDLGSGLVSEFWSRYPQFPVRFLHCDSARGVGEAVVAGRADVGIADLPVTYELVGVPFEWREVVLLAPPGSGLPDPLPAALLGELALVVPTAGSARRAELERLFADLRVTPTVAFESDERASWLPAVTAGLGCCLWYRARGGAAGAPGVDVRRLDPPLQREIAVVHRPERLDAAVAGLVELARSRAQ